MIVDNNIIWRITDIFMVSESNTSISLSSLASIIENKSDDTNANPMQTQLKIK